VATTLWSVVFDSPRPEALADWWAAALGWSVVPPTEYDAEVVCRHDPGVPRLGFERVPGLKVVKNRIHLDLASASTAEQTATVDRLHGMGATLLEAWSTDVPWVVLADVEGNEFCVLEPRDRYTGLGSLAAIVVDVADPGRLGDFYAAATGWVVGERGGGVVSLSRPGGRPPDLDLVQVSDVKLVKNRVHLDVAPCDDADADAEAIRLRSLGALDVDVGQPPSGSWRVLADVEGNEFCVLSPR